MSTETTDQVQIARDLREIVRLYGNLRAQSYYAGVSTDASDIESINLLGPAAKASSWEATYEAAVEEAEDAEEGFSDYVVDQVGENHPLYVLAFWEDVIRDELGTPTTRRATVTDAAKYLGSAITWMFDVNEYGDVNFIASDQLARDLARCRAGLEGVLKDGIRRERTETPCEEPSCGKRLVKVYGTLVSLDHYICPDHEKPLDYAEYVGVRQRHMWSERADDAWIDISAAAKSINRSQFTIRQWMKPAPSTPVPFHGRKVQSRRVGSMRRIEVYWPDVREQDRLAIRKDKLRRARIA